MAAGEFAIKNYYEILLISKEDANNPVKLSTAYHSRLRDLSPNRHFEEFSYTTANLLVAEAYEILSDPDKKALYDQVSDYKGNAPSAEEVDRILCDGKAEMYLYIPGGSEETILARKMSFNREKETLKVALNDRNLETETLLLAIKPKKNSELPATPIGLITVSKDSNKFVLFSFVEGLKAASIKQGLTGDGLKSISSLGFGAGEVNKEGRKDYYGITQHLVTYESYSSTLAPHEKKYADDTAANLAGRFNSTTKIEAINQAVAEDSRVLLISALKRPRKLEFWTATSAQNMPASLREPRPVHQSAEPVPSQEEIKQPEEQPQNKSPRAR